MYSRLYTYILTISCILAALLPAVAGPASAGDDASKPFDEYKVKAVFIYNFTKFVEWPGAQSLAQTHMANICIAGDNPFHGKLDILKQASSPQLSFNIKKDVGEGDIPGCQILFISKSESANVTGLLSAARNYPVLTVSDIEGFSGKDGMVEMEKTVNNIGKESIKLIINVRSAEEKQLRIDAQLLGIAAEVIK